jgi:LuxR family maltose regulon positive regulatory protein
MGYLDYEWNNLEAASHHFSQAVEKRYFMDVNSPIDSYAGLIFTCQAMQQSDKANEIVKLMLEFARQSNYPGLVILARSVQARLSLLQGDLQSASRWLEMADISADAGNMFLWLEQPCITRCRVLLAQGSETSLREATEKLDEYGQLCQATHNTPQMIQILLLQVVARQKQEQFDEAMSALEMAVNLARPGGFIRPFVETGPELTQYLEKLRSQGVAPDYIGQILTAVETKDEEPETVSPAVPHGPASSLIEPLTDRELDVLQLLAQRFSRKEIAAELFISPLTVKTHATNIYQKLGVKNRRQAVSKAISLGLVSTL